MVTAVIIKALQFILSLSLLVVLHELGHFIPAKIFKTKVEKFFLFFDVKFALYKKKIGETVYGIGWLPLGGYVKIAGMIDESMDTEQMKAPVQPWEFRSKPAWQRLIIMIGGVTVNLVLGILIYIMILWVWGETQIRQQDIPQGYMVSSVMKSYGFEDGDIPLKINDLPVENTLQVNKYLMLRDVHSITVRHSNGTEQRILLPESIGSEIFQKNEMHPFTPWVSSEILHIQPESTAEKAGLIIGDKILSVNGQVVENANQVNEVKANSKDYVQLEILRDNQVRKVDVPLQDGKMGIYFKTAEYKTYTKKYGIIQAITHGFSYGYNTLRDYISQFKYIFTKKGASEIGGFASMGNMFHSSWNWEVFWHTTALFSIILAFMNILPIPALDGGHVVFLLYEMITGKTPNQKVLEYAQTIGFIILLAIVLYANANDVWKIFFK